MFRLLSPRVITIIGGGGKTSLMYYLLTELKRASQQSVATATTKLSAKPRLGHRFVIAKNLADAAKAVAENGCTDDLVTLMAGFDAATPEKLIGIEADWIDKLAERVSETIIVVEGDGAAGKSLKGHLAHEPVIPLVSSLVIVVIGIDCIGTALTAENVHRPERVGELTGAAPGLPITAEVVVRLLFHSSGYLHNCPRGSMVLPFINKVESIGRRQQAEKLAELILSVQHPAVSGVMLGSVQQQEFSFLPAWVERQEGL